MARRKGWGQLSPKYRKRLEGAGINRRAYESGATIKGARGHARTREHATSGRHIRAHGSVVEQWEVGHRANERWYYSDVTKAMRQVRPSKTGMYRIAITGVVPLGEELSISRNYKGEVQVDEGGQEWMETTVGAKISQNDLMLSIERNRIGRYYVDMGAVAEEITGVEWAEVQSISIATGAPPQGMRR